MGNSPSSPSASFDPNAFARKSRTPPPSSRRASAIAPGRRTSTSGSNNGLLAPPLPHRRSRSAHAADTRSIASNATAPPPYSPVADNPPPVPPHDPRPTRRSSNNSNSANSPSSSSGSRRSRGVARSNSYSMEDALQILRKYDTVLVVDDSKSMAGNLWREARDALASLADTAAKYDVNGIDVYFLNDKRVGKNMRTSQSVKQLFDSVRPHGITPIGEKLEELLLEYLDALESAKNSGDTAAWKAIKPVSYVVLTDGAPTDDPEDVIVNAARRLDSKNFPMTQVGIQFVQIGSSAKATAYLQELDDGLSAHHGVRDIVDTTPYSGGQLTAEVLTKILIGGINRRVDRRGAESVMAE